MWWKHYFPVVVCLLTLYHLCSFLLPPPRPPAPMLRPYSLDIHGYQFSDFVTYFSPLMSIFPCLFVPVILLLHFFTVNSNSSGMHFGMWNESEVGSNFVFFPNRSPIVSALLNNPTSFHWVEMATAPLPLARVIVSTGRPFPSYPGCSRSAIVFLPSCGFRQPCETSGSCLYLSRILDTCGIGQRCSDRSFQFQILQEGSFIRCFLRIKTEGSEYMRPLSQMRYSPRTQLTS